MVNLDYLYNPDAAKPYFDKDYFVDKKLSFQVIENGTILPYKKMIDGKPTKDWWGYGGIVDSEGNFIKSSHVYCGSGSSYIPSPESVLHSSETVIYLGMFHSTWGHAITDNIRRLWFLKSDEFKNQFKNCPLVYLLCTKLKLFTLNDYESFRRLLEILEVDVDRLQLIKEPTKFGKIILPDESFMAGGKFNNEYSEMINQIRNFAIKNRTPTSSKKIYYFHGARQTGEEQIAEYFKSKGYEVICPEKLPFDEQLNILINAESFASTLGSTSHNSIFLRDGTETIFIPRTARSFTNVYQRTLNQVNSVSANYVNSTLNIFGSFYSNVFYISSPQLKRFFGDKWDGYSEEQIITFLNYVKNSMKTGGIINWNEVKNCEEVYRELMTQTKQREDLITAYNMPLHWEEFRSTLTYTTHVAKNGWSAWISEEEISNDIAQKFDIQAIKINFQNYKVYYSVYYNEQEGWSEEVLSPEMAGTTGKRKPIMGIRIRFDELGAKEFDILYRVHKFDGEWTDWARNGETIYSHGQQLNAIQIKLEPKN